MTRLISTILKATITYITLKSEPLGSVVLILIRNGIPQSKINLNTNLQAIAAKATIHRTINICSVYIPLQDSIQENDLSNLIQLPKPFIIDYLNRTEYLKGSVFKLVGNWLLKVGYRLHSTCLWQTKAPLSLNVPPSASCVFYACFKKKIA